MREKIAYVETITALKPIPKANKIECAQILGWEVVVQKGQFNVGDKVVYCEIDSILPELPPFEFLRPRKFRIRTVKMRDQISQGIAFSLSVINEVDPSVNIDKLKVGADLTDILKIVKYDPEAALDVDELDQVRPPWIVRRYRFLKWKLFGIKPIKRGDFPSDVRKTDEARVQHMARLLGDREGQPVYISEKIDGTSSTFVYRRTGNWFARLFGKDYVFQVCSRNRIIYNSQKGGHSDHHIVKMAEKYDIESKMKKIDRNIAIQGETVGGKIQGNVYKLPELEMRVFLIWDIDTQRYLPYQETMDLVREMGLQFVPVVDDNAVVVNDIKYYVELSKGKSRINPDKLREGIVIRGRHDDFSFKSISPEYLLKQD